VRKQFKNPKTKLETRLLDYRVNHYRLITRFALHFVQNVGMTQITEFWNKNVTEGVDSSSKDTNFVHLISSVAKAVFTWTTFDTVGESRQALGGIGYSSYNGIGVAMPVMDLNRTWEGDNNILMQQAGKLILKNLANLFMEKPLMQTFEFLTIDIPEQKPYKKTLDDVSNLLELLTIRAITLIHETGNKLQFSEDKVAEWDRLLTFSTNPMTFAYFTRFLLSNYIDFLNNFNGDLKTKKVFERLGVIYAQKAIIDDAGFFRDYLSKEQIDGMKDDIMDHLQESRKEVIAMTYLLPFTDKMIGSVGKLEMKPYENFLDTLDKSERVKSDDIDGDIILSTA